MTTDAYRALIASPRVAASTRAALLARDMPDDPLYRPAAIGPDQLATLRAVADRVIPQEPWRAIDLGARIDAALAAGPRDGWRFALLPPDVEAYRAALDTLEGMAQAAYGQGFARLDGAARDAMLSDVASGRSAGAGLSGAQMKLWFQDLCADAVDAYVAHPDTLARMGYSGIANGGDGARKSGFVQVGPGETEPWEPRPDPAA